MRETRLSGSEGGARFNPLSLPLSRCKKVGGDLRGVNLRNEDLPGACAVV